MEYNLTERVINAARWFVHKSKDGSLPEEFDVYFPSNYPPRGGVIDLDPEYIDLIKAPLITTNILKQLSEKRLIRLESIETEQTYPTYTVCLLPNIY